MIYAAICLALLSACFFSVNARESLMTRFANWAHEHNIDVPEEDRLFLHMYENWVANDKLIDETNAKNLSYTLGHNVYSGMSLAEFAEHMHFGMNREFFGDAVSEATVSEDTNFLRGSEYGALPTSVDWRTKGAVSPVQDQGQAGTCYSFGTSCAVESAHAIKTGNLVKLSEQQIVSCSTISQGGPNMGVNGGQIAPTFKWIGKVGGLCTEQAYPYTSGTTKETGSCQTTCSKVAGTAPSSVVNVKANSDADMMTAIATTVVSIAIEADQASFQLYKSGVFTGSCGTKLDHATALVGYGSDYYIMRNSWGTTWGESGYMRIGKGNDPATGKPYNGGAGQCGLLMEGSYPVL